MSLVYSGLETLSLALAPIPSADCLAAAAELLVRYIRAGAAGIYLLHAYYGIHR